MKRSRKYGTARLFSSPSLLRTESVEDFNAFSRDVRRSLQPHGAIEEMYVGDILFATWELIRYNQAKTNIIKIAYPKAVQVILAEHGPTSDPALSSLFGSECAELEHGVNEELALSWISSSAAHKKVCDFLRKFGLDENAIEAEAIALSMPKLEKIEQNREFGRAPAEPRSCCFAWPSSKLCDHRAGNNKSNH